MILDMLNQEEDHGHHSVTKVIEFKEVPQYQTICSNFYPIAHLEETNYLKNNEIKFRLWLKVI